MTICTVPYDRLLANTCVTLSPAEPPGVSNRPKITDPKSQMEAWCLFSKNFSPLAPMPMKTIDLETNVVTILILKLWLKILLFQNLLIL